MSKIHYQTNKGHSVFKNIITIKHQMKDNVSFSKWYSVNCNQLATAIDGIAN